MATAEEGGERSTGTLGHVLYADKWQALVSEKDWVALVQSIVAGDQHALHALYERTHLIVGGASHQHPGNRGRADFGCFSRRVAAGLEV